MIQIPIYDAYDRRYKSRFGAIKQHSACEFSLKFARVMNVTEPILVVQSPASKEKHIPLEVSDDTDSLYVTYSCNYTPTNKGAHYYYFVAKQNDNRTDIKRKGTNLGTWSHDGGHDLFQLTVYDPQFDTPDWLKGGVMYQIFPDRFSKSDKADIPAAAIDRVIHSDWNTVPVWQPNEHGMITNNDFYGGNLKGIEENLEYLEKLGITAIYLNPIFEAHENHRYNTANYELVDSMLGTNKDFTELCETAKKHGIGIILDGVFSHTGADSVYFNKNGRYGENSGAYRDPESPYREWYCWMDYPHVYESWWGMTTLPNVNENNPSYTEYICGEGGVLQKWLDLGAMGWRLDVADELPDEFIDALTKAVKAKGDDKVIYGEVWEDATTKESYGVRRRYLLGGQLDSTMNYPFKEAILNYIKYGAADSFRDGVMTILEHYPKPSVDILMNFLSTHDIERAITRLAGQEVGTHDRQWQSENGLNEPEYVYGVALLKCAMTLMFFLPGIPCIYYGDEAGQEGYRDPFNRRTYPWGMENMDLIDFTTELSRIRKSSDVFKKGELEFIEVSRQHCVLRRIDRELGEGVTIYLNRSRRSTKFNLNGVRGKPEPSKNPKNLQILRGVHCESGRLQVSPYDFAAIKYTLAET
ncbi:MAG: glycoside hydrolase family 13 protein [Oscillospiraceae bacterium]|nr:glycoside hydrolase family 13 protein [Oscillospiraceae bacterium]